MCNALIISNSINNSVTNILRAAFATLSITQKKIEDDFTPYSLVILKLGEYTWSEKVENLSLTELKAIQYCYYNNIPIYISYIRKTEKDMHLHRISVQGGILRAIQGSRFPPVTMDNCFHIITGTIPKENLFCINTIEDRIRMLEGETYTDNPGVKVDETPLPDPIRIQYPSKENITVKNHNEYFATAIDTVSIKEQTTSHICTQDNIIQKRDKRLLIQIK